MSKIYIGNILISDIVRTNPPLKSSGTVIKNTLLDGSNHIQQIGKPSEYIEVSCLINETKKIELDKAYEEVKLIRLIRYEKEHLGHIEEIPSYEQIKNSIDIAKRLYRADFTLLLGVDY